MDIKADIKWIAEELARRNDPALIEFIKKVVAYREKRGEQRISIEQYNKEIDHAIEQVENGHFITHEALLKEMEKW